MPEFTRIFKHLPLFLNIYLHFFQETPSLDAPAGCPGRSHPRTSSARHCPERIHFKVLSLTYNSLQSSQPTCIPSRTLHHPAIRSTRSSSCLILSQPPVTSHLMFSSRAISITAPLLRNDLPPELHTVSLPPPPLSSITRRLL